MVVRMDQVVPFKIAIAAGRQSIVGREQELALRTKSAIMVSGQTAGSEP
jgi:hypothetical protein